MDVMAALNARLGPSAKADDSIPYWLKTSLPNVNYCLSNDFGRAIPGGRIIGISGPSSSGKCLTADTRLLSEHGLVTMRELFGFGSYALHEMEGHVDHEVGLINERGEIEKTAQLHWNGLRAIRRVRSATGRTISLTHNNPVRVMVDGDVAWKDAGDLVVGDLLVTLCGTRAFGRGTLSADEARLIGYLIADGSLGYENSVRFSNSDLEVAAEYARLVEELTGCTVRTIKKAVGSTVYHYTYNQEARRKLADRYGLGYVRAAGKKVPFCVRAAGEAAQKTFLRAVFELECSISGTNHAIELTTASAELARDLQLMLLNLGIVASLNVKRVVGYEQSYYRLHLSGDNYDRFMAEIGFETSARLAQVRERARPTGRTYTRLLYGLAPLVKRLYDACPTTRASNRLCGRLLGTDHGVGISRDRLGEILDHFASALTPAAREPYARLRALLEDDGLLVDRVVAISEDEEATFDVSMPETHSLWADGFVAHNTALMTELMVQAQAGGGYAALNDHEYAWEMRHAVRHGLDEGRFVYKQPISAEAGFNHLYNTLHSLRAIESGYGLDRLDKGGTSKFLEWLQANRPTLSPLVFGVDSIAALIPEEQDVAYGKLNMKTKNMAVAAMLSVELKKVSRDASITKSTIILINQLRENPGITFGDSTVEPGGRSAEYFSSIRLRLRRSDRVYADWGESKDSEAVGDVVEMKVVKNKTASPFRRTKYVFRHTDPVGLDLASTLVVLGKEAGVLGPKDGKTVLLDGRTRRINDLLPEARADRAVMGRLLVAVLPTVKAGVDASVAEGLAA